VLLNNNTLIQEANTRMAQKIISIILRILLAWIDSANQHEQLRLWKRQFLETSTCHHPRLVAE
jgi:hypothetical protein